MKVLDVYSTLHDTIETRKSVRFRTPRVCLTRGSLALRDHDMTSYTHKPVRFRCVSCGCEASRRVQHTLRHHQDLQSGAISAILAPIKLSQGPNQPPLIKLSFKSSVFPDKMRGLGPPLSHSKWFPSRLESVNTYINSSIYASDK